MFLKVLLLALFVGVVMADLTLEQQWDSYKKQFAKSYPPDEDTERFEIFKKNVKQVNEINKNYEQGTGTWKAELNKFSDLRDEEKRRYNGLIKPGLAGTS